ncbi:MAG: AAA family ATPase [Crocinitomicaceae bacterium]|nr:AAA family ATPase [Crocinitomicaceae bacterium]
MELSPFKQQLLYQFQFEFTSDQSTCVDQLELFLKDSAPYCAFLLSGYAGTGKTSLLGAFIKTLAHYKINTTLLAPTGKAAKVLSSKSSKRAFTIHKMIYRRKNKTDDFSTLQLAPNLQKNTIFIVDEASMIGDYTMVEGNVNQRNLLEDLLEYVFSGQHCKLILLGDVGQLPPVGSNFSPALNSAYLSNNFPRLTLYTAQLNEVLRQQKDSDILLNATNLRNFKSSFYQFEVHPNADIALVNGTELQDFLEHSFSNYGTDETILITRSNKRCNEYNRQIRARVFWYEELVCNGDLLMVVKNNYHWLKDEPEMGFIANGETMIVKRVLKHEHLYGFDFIRLSVLFPDYEQIGEQEVIIHSESLMCEGASLPRERLKELFFEVEKDYLYEHNKKKRYELILANPYFNALQVKFGYAVTCHKSQGGQWEHVFIDVGFLPEDLDMEEYNRWLYTALTRAKSKVFLVNFPEEQLLNIS